MAGNCLAFALYVLRAAGQGNDLKVGNVRGLALGVAVLACFIHAFSRRGGIVLNNILAVFKLSVLLLIVVTTIIHATKSTDNTSKQMTDQDAFNGQGQANGFASAFLSIGEFKVLCSHFSSYYQHLHRIRSRSETDTAFIAFAFGGFEQPNYVLGEIRRPRKTFPRATIFGVLLACLLYMAVNVCYVSNLQRSSF